MLKNSGFNKKKILMKPEFFMDGKEVFSFAINKVPKLINEIIRRSKIKNISLIFYSKPVERCQRCR